VNEPGALLASGRDSDVFEYGSGLVLRRSREGHSMSTEARTMEYVRGLGYPVPAIAEISDDGTDLVMERVDGPSMLDEIGRRPWTVRRQARLLARLHQRLHRIPAPEWLPAAPCGEGDRLVHAVIAPFDSAQLKAQLADVVAWKVKDPHMSEVEQKAMWSLLREHREG
jgi:hypothetical protein